MSDLSSTKLEDRLALIPKNFTGEVAQIGFPRGQEYEDGTSVAYVAAIQNYGAPEVSIPPRPFMEPTVQKHKAEWVAQMKGGIKRVSEGSLTAFDVLDGVGRLAVSDIQQAIADIDSPALSPVTVLLRKWQKEGRTITGKTVGEAAAAIASGEDPGGDDKPLNASGLLIASVRNGVAKAGAEFDA